ncbi:MAG: type II toxin-antitoxin system VapC family toxin [Planctomycetia bacterium]|nr:type II toxin-antitoxin system VapC family toxin [Planctomycetia bacterium]
MLTFIDADVLIAAARGTAEISDTAIAILEDPNRTFASSDFIRLEVLPKSTFTGRAEETAFYEEFFAGVSAWPRDANEVVAAALEEAKRSGLSALDALHVAAARVVGADEIVTGEKPGRPIHRTSLVRIVSLRSSPPAGPAGGSPGPLAPPPA